MSTATALQPEIDDERLYRIGEVSRLSDLKPFVLRYWETEFPMLEPVKSPSGHRMYRQQDVDMVFKIKRLLYDEGFTIAGARRHLRETNGMIGVEPSARAAATMGSEHASAANADSSYSAAAGADGSAASGHAMAGRAPTVRTAENATDLLSRKMLLDLRDSLRGFLTLLERRSGS
jgi:DNA-binding transcriptional MerR regulator